MCQESDASVKCFDAVLGSAVVPRELDPDDLRDVFLECTLRHEVLNKGGYLVCIVVSSLLLSLDFANNSLICGFTRGHTSQARDLLLV